MLESLETKGQMAYQAPEVSVIVPTFNERDNVPEVVRRLDACLKGVPWEVIFVDDDSPDGTADRVREIGRQDRRVRCVQRIGRRGLSSACTEGMMASSAPYLAIMDGDCQHDEGALPRMLDVLRAGEADIVVGSRYTAGGGIGNWDENRAKMSRFATRLSRLVIKQDLSDPMSGFFALRSDALNPAVRKLSNIGFKILLDLLASSPKQLRLKEVPYEFRTRHAGESKMDSQAMWDYLMLLLDKLVGHIVPVRFVAFGLVGAVGLLLHFAVLTILFRGMGRSFAFSQASASIVAMVSNFSLNNALTFRDMRLKGWSWIKGLALFVLVCGIGALANVGIASYLFTRNSMWVLAALTGIVVGAVWNYAMSAMYTWGKRKR
ncbi:MAG TPA: glycosyltransferase family 2 protein [Candidatus Dormibacteraeota bacterium]|nr:glycosyltransferase family 2 protein [Candidatus Dormibacteraeota bacterium]